MSNVDEPLRPKQRIVPWIVLSALIGLVAAPAMSVVNVTHSPPSDSPTTMATPATAPATRPLSRRGNFLTYLPGMVDRSKVLDTPQAFDAGTFENCRVISSAPPRIVLADTNERSFPREGQWTTPVMQADIPFTEFIPYWNADVPPDCGISVEASVRDHATGKWSPWLFVGDWGRPLPAEHLEHFDGGDLRVDNLQLTHPADAFAFRVHFNSYALEPKIIPDLRRLGVLYSGVVPAYEHQKWKVASTEPTGWVRDLPVPYRAQGDLPRSLSSQCCSPTSVSMVLAYWGIDRPLAENAMGIYDSEHQLFGNWNRAVQYPASLGLDAWLKRFRNWNDVKAEIASGTPVIASIKFNAGEFPSEVLKSSKGHLIVVRGFTAAGDAICNDPGRRGIGKDVIYKADELGHAWFDKSGVGYVIRAPAATKVEPTSQPAKPLLTAGK